VIHTPSKLNSPGDVWLKRQVRLVAADPGAVRIKTAWTTQKSEALRA